MSFPTSSEVPDFTHLNTLMSQLGIPSSAPGIHEGNLASLHTQQSIQNGLCSQGGQLGQSSESSQNSLSSPGGQSQQSPHTSQQSSQTSQSALCSQAGQSQQSSQTSQSAPPFQGGLLQQGPVQSPISGLPPLAGNDLSTITNLLQTLIHMQSFASTHSPSAPKASNVSTAPPIEIPPTTPFTTNSLQKRKVVDDHCSSFPMILISKVLLRICV